jgi:hypothetical protein
MAQNLSKTTTDHDQIRRWTEERGGSPAEVEATASEDQTGILRIDFPGYSGAGTLRHIDWDEWFRKFDEAGLAFVYEDETSGGDRSNFNKLVARETAAARARGVRTSRRASGKSRSASRTRSRGTARGTSRRSSRGGARAGGSRSRSAGASARKTARAGSRAGKRAGARTGTRTAKRGSGRRQASRGTVARSASRSGSKSRRSSRTSRRSR